MDQNLCRSSAEDKHSLTFVSVLIHVFPLSCKLSSSHQVPLDLLRIQQLLRAAAAITRLCCCCPSIIGSSVQVQSARNNQKLKPSEKIQGHKSEEANCASFFSAGSLIWVSPFIYLSSPSLSLFHYLPPSLQSQIKQEKSECVKGEVIWGIKGAEHKTHWYYSNKTVNIWSLIYLP